MKSVTSHSNMDSSNKRKLTELYPIESPSSPDKKDLNEPTQMICLKLFLLVVYVPIRSL